MVIAASASLHASAAKTTEAGACDCDPTVTATETNVDLQDPTQMETTQPGAHDPVIVKDGNKYFLFLTGRGTPFRVSNDMKTWGPENRVFATPPAWAVEAVPGFKDHIWAPDLAKFGGKWHLYYSISTFGKNRSAIGHATNETLDPTHPKYKWVDHGPVVQSFPENDYNAIDANVVLDEKGTPWLSFGSFWGGLRLVQLDKDGKQADPNQKPINIAQRPEPPDAIEAPYIIRRGGYFYQFASFDFCCRGANSTYNIRVGRSKDVRGPYVDRTGKPMTQGGGTLLVEGGPRWKGPGHQAVVQNGKNDTLVFHAYDAENNGRPMLQLAKITWDREGWPVVTWNP